MKKDREKELLTMAAECFAQGMNPFGTEQLVRHQVTMDECMDLSETLAMIVKGFVAMPDQGKRDIVVRAVLSDTGLDAEQALNGLRMGQLLKEMKKLRT